MIEIAREAYGCARRFDAGPIFVGTATRLSPEAAVPVVDFVSQSECLGGAGNVAVNLRRSGACRDIWSDWYGRGWEGFAEMFAERKDY